MSDRQRLKEIVIAWQAGRISTEATVDAMLDICDKYNESEYADDDPNAILAAVEEALIGTLSDEITPSDIAVIREFVETPPGHEREALARWRARWAPKVTIRQISIDLSYVSAGEDKPPNVWRNFPVDPKYTDELRIAIDSFDHPDEPQYRPGVMMEGSSRALESLGKYLIALARSESSNPDLNTHLLDVASTEGGTVHVILRRNQLLVKSDCE